MHNSGCHGNQDEKLQKLFLSKTIGHISKTFDTNGPWVTLYQKYSYCFDWLKNTAASGRVQFFLCLYTEIFKKNLVRETALSVVVVLLVDSFSPLILLFLDDLSVKFPTTRQV